MSGGHLNPAVTVALAVSGKLKRMQMIPAYLLGQYLGSFFGAAVVFGIYHGQHNCDNFFFRIFMTYTIVFFVFRPVDVILKGRTERVRSPGHCGYIRNLSVGEHYTGIILGHINLFSNVQ